MSNGQTKICMLLDRDIKEKKNGLKKKTKQNDESVVDSQAPAPCFVCCVEKVSYQWFRAFPLGTARTKGQQCCHLDKFLRACVCRTGSKGRQDRHKSQFLNSQTSKAEQKLRKWVAKLIKRSRQDRSQQQANSQLWTESLEQEQRCVVFSKIPALQVCAVHLGFTHFMQTGREDVVHTIIKSHS